MNIQIEKLGGIKNKIELKIEDKNIIFAPNGVGKTSIVRGLSGINNGLVNNGIFICNQEELKDSMLILNEDQSEDIIEKPWEWTKSFFENKILEKGFFKKEDRISIQSNIIELYNKVVCELNSKSELKINFEKIKFKNNLDDFESVEIIIKILSESNPDFIPSEDDIIILNKALDDLINLQEIKTPEDYKKLEKEIKELDKENNEYNNEVARDFPLIEKILISGSKNFLFKYNNEILSIDEAKIKLEEIYNENGIDPKSVCSYNAYVKLINNYNNISKSKKRISKSSEKQLNTIKEFLDEQKKQLLYLKVKEHEKEIKEFKKQHDNNNSLYIQNMNKEIKKINESYLLNKYLKWNYRITYISSVFDEINIECYFDNKKQDKDKIKNRASKGQRRVLALILFFIKAEEKDFFVIDDFSTSLDSDHINVFKKLVENYSKKIIIFTHNYNLVQKLSWDDGEKNEKKINIILLDAYKENKVVSYIPEKEEIILKNWLNKPFKKWKPQYTLLVATIIREMIVNYILRKDEERNETISSQLNNIKKNIDVEYRHWRIEGSNFIDANKNVIKNIDNSELLNFLQSNMNNYDFFFNNIKEEIENYEQLKKISISSFVLNFIKEHKTYKFENFIEYISYKFVFALNIRFKIEENIIFHILGKEHSLYEEWKNNRIHGIEKLINHKEMDIDSKLKISNLWNFYKDLDFVNHLNNLSWDAVIEIPLYKLEQYIELIDKEIKLCKT